MAFTYRRLFIKNVNATRKMMIYVKLEEAQEKTFFPSFSDGK